MGSMGGGEGAEMSQRQEKRERQCLTDFLLVF